MTDMNKTTAEMILGITGSYSADELRSAYRCAVKANHPDKVEAAGGNGDAATKRMANINAAYDYLSKFFDGNRERVEATAKSNEEPAKEPPAEEVSMAKAPADIIDAEAAASARREQMKEQAAAASMAEERFGQYPIWYGIAEMVAEHFPYRIAMVLIAISVFGLLGGVNIFATMGYAPVGWKAPNVNVFAFIGAIALFIASLLNLIFGFATNPIREAILRKIKRAGNAARERSAAR